jgi:hypothetical protein
MQTKGSTILTVDLQLVLDPHRFQADVYVRLVLLFQDPKGEVLGGKLFTELNETQKERGNKKN